MTSPKQADELLKAYHAFVENFNNDRAIDDKVTVGEFDFGLAVLEHFSASLSSPPGEWQWVPKEPTDNQLFAILRALHSNVPEDQQPKSWSDCSDEQIERIKCAGKAFLAAAPSSGEAKTQHFCVHPECDDGWIRDKNDPTDGGGPCPVCSRAEPPAAQGEAEALFIEANSLCRSALSIAEREGKETNWEAFRNRLKESLAKQLPVINSLRDVSAELTIEETQRLLGAESPIPVDMPTDPVAMKAVASQLYDQLRHPAPQVDADVKVHHSDIADLNPVLELRSPVVEALTELVALKDLKDANTVDGMWLLDSPHIEYDLRKSLAWEKAREALARHPGAETLSEHDFHLLSRIENIIRQSHPDEASDIYALWKRLRSPVAQWEAGLRIRDCICADPENCTQPVIGYRCRKGDVARRPSHPTGSGGWLPCEPQKQVGFSYFLQTLYRKRSDGQWFAYYVPDLPDYKAAPPKPTAPNGGGL
jgi:hypothetical protein